MAESLTVLSFEMYADDEDNFFRRVCRCVLSGTSCIFVRAGMRNLLCIGYPFTGFNWDLVELETPQSVSVSVEERRLMSTVFSLLFFGFFPVNFRRRLSHKSGDRSVLIVRL